jgi:hypothetical protein
MALKLNNKKIFSAILNPLAGSDKTNGRNNLSKKKLKYEKFMIKIKNY